MIDDGDIEKALDYLRSTAQEAAQARANVKHLQEFLDVKVAQIVKAMPGVSAATAKLTAKAHEEYVALLEGYKVAVEQDAFHTFKRDAADAMIRAWQTQQSTLRAEGRAYS